MPDHGGDGEQAAPLRVLVATVAHRGDDARIAFRQIGALTAAGMHVLYVAPEPVVDAVRVAERIVVRRARGARRLRAWWQVMRIVHRRRADVDVVLVHDLELVLPVRLTRPRATVVWDVHEDLVASVADRAWIPRLARRPITMATAAVERVARWRTGLLLAERSYAERLGDWPIVPNTAVVDDRPPGRDGPRDDRKVIYVGRLSRGRGLDTMIDVARGLGDAADVVLVGPADDDVLDTVEAAVRDGVVDWRGPLPNPVALRELDDALVGLCLLRPLPNYVGSMPTKIHEYAARGLATVSTPLPLAAAALEESGGGVVVPFDDPAAVCTAIRAYLADPAAAREHGRRAHAWAFANHNWTHDAVRFVDAIRASASNGLTPGARVAG